MHRFNKRPLFHAVYLFSLLIAIMGFTKTISAQTTTGSIYGTVMDSTGAVIPNAGITVANIDTNQVLTTHTNDSGEYLLPVVNPGNYKVTATKASFASVMQINVIVAANQNVNATFHLKAGASADVSVEATTNLIDTRESQLGETIDQKRIEDLPLSGRSAYDLVQLVPGITAYAASAQYGDSTGTQFSTNGLRTSFNSFYLDGAYDTSFFRGGGNVIPNPDALSEFRVLTSNFDSEFGRYPGAVVNTVTRSGTNAIHGVAYDYLRNNMFNAKNYFATSVAHLVYNVFGGGAGGPIIKNRLFAFFPTKGFVSDSLTS